MTHLRQIMLEELRRRNFAETTIRSYLHGVEHFSRYFHRPPDQLGPEHIRQYQAMLFTKLKFSPNTVTLRLAALRFFYIHVLLEEKLEHRRDALSKEGVSSSGDSHPGRGREADRCSRVSLSPHPADDAYATGARRAEVARLKISDIDSQRMIVHIRAAGQRPQGP